MSKPKESTVRMSLVEKDGKEYTRYRFPLKYVGSFRTAIQITGEKVKESTRYVYYDVEGNLLK